MLDIGRGLKHLSVLVFKQKRTHKTDDRVCMQAVVFQPSVPCPLWNNAPSYNDACRGIKGIQRTQNVCLGGIFAIPQSKSQKLHGGGHRLGTERSRTFLVSGRVLCHVSSLRRSFGCNKDCKVALTANKEIAIALVRRSCCMRYSRPGPNTRRSSSTRAAFCLRNSAVVESSPCML